MRRSTALVCAGLTTLALTASGPATGAGPATTSFRDVAGLDSPRGLDIGDSGRMVVAVADGTIYKVIRNGPHRGTTHRIAKVPAGFIAPAVAVSPDDAVWIQTSAGLYLKEPGAAKKRLVRNIPEWVAANAHDPYDLEGAAEESNPYGVAALPGGSALVADAANNAVFKVTRSGAVSVVARVMPRIIDTPDSMDDPETTEDDQMPTEAVTTSVAVGRDGSVYIGELRGFPGTPGTAQVWKVDAGAHHAVCDPTGEANESCTRFADGLTSVVALEAGRGGSVYVAEMSKMGWLAVEDENAPPEAFIGSVIRIGHDPVVREELMTGEIALPGGVARGGNGGVFVTTPFFGPGAVMQVN